MAGGGGGERPHGTVSAMFTGLVQTMGRIARLAPTPSGVRLVVDASRWDHRPAPGDSISVNGVCLTVAPPAPPPDAPPQVASVAHPVAPPEAGADWRRAGRGETVSRASGAPAALGIPGALGVPGALAFDVVRETLDKTTLGGLREGGLVNLEHACRADTLLGGHIVQGHVDGVGRVVEALDDPTDWRIVIEPPPGLLEFAAPKGSIAIDGVSLTIARLLPERAAGAPSPHPPSRVEIALIPTTLERTTLGLTRVGDPCNLEMDCIAKQVVWWLRNYGGAEEGAGGPFTL